MLETPTKGRFWQLFIDGASRNNPGPAGAGVYLKCDGAVYVAQGYFLGRLTNNEAEYAALLIGLAVCLPLVQPGDALVITSDSQLLVQQMTGNYRVRKPELLVLYTKAQGILNRMSGVLCSFRHVLREFNKDADKLANQGIEKQQLLPEQFHALLVRQSDT